MGKLNFDVDAYTARLIGRENVSRLESAILELVKNTYDADASCCVLYFEASTNTLYLADNGDGMSTEVIRKHWMTIGNSSKKSKYTSGKGRIQTGAKGIGRFALDRIGDKCTMYTRSANENLEWNIDWSSFKDGTPLTEVTAELDSVSYGFTNFVDSALNSAFKKLIAHRFTGTGTIFKISPVRDNWSESFIKNLKSNLSTLIPQEISSFFTIFFFEENTNTDDAELVLSVAEAICDYKISFSVDGDIVRTAIFRNEFDFKAQKDKILSEAGFGREDGAYFSGEAIIEENRFSRLMSSGKKTVQNTIGSFSGVFLFSKLFYMDGDREKYYYKNSKQMSLPWSGIRIYRDNFRVRPYGDPDSSAYDWLLLSNRKAKSPAAPSHPSGKWRVRADQICGTILISRTNIGLPDQANREGFVETEEFKLLKNFLLKIIERFERDRQYVFRTLSPYYDITHPTERFEAEIAKKAMIAAKQFSDSNGNENDSGRPQYGNDGSTKSLASSVDASKAQAVINKKEEQIKALEDENQLLRVLATIGIVTNTYVHEIRANTNNLELKLTMARESLKYDQDIQTALRHLGEADNYLQSFGSWFKVTIESVRKDRRTMKQVDISVLLKDLIDAWRNTCNGLQIKLNCGDIKFRCFPYEIESIFNNLIANSTAAFKSVRQNEQSIRIDVDYDGEYLRISYEDNGPGLSPKYKNNPDLILESMETDKTDADGEIVGTGMGMWIIWKTVEEYKGTIDLSENLSDDTGFHIKLSLKGRGQMDRLRIGFVDDENINFDDYATRLKRENIELLFYEGESTVDSIIDWLITEDILCLLVDYDLQKKFTQNGTDLVFAINQLLPDFPCIMVTNYPEQSKNEKIVSNRLIRDRKELAASDLSNVIDMIKNEVEVYLKRKASLSEEYAHLIEKRNDGRFTVVDEERLMQLHALFSKYGETDDLPSPLLSSETNKKLDCLIDRLTQLVEKKEE